MEQGQLGLDAGLEGIVAGEAVPNEEIASHTFPSLDLFGLEYVLSVQYRPEVDFQVEDMESVLSEKLVDMDEDWFTPTVARHREGESRGQSGQLAVDTRRASGPAPIPGYPSPIPQRQGPASIGSFRGSLGRQGSGKVAGLPSSGRSGTPGSLSKWGALAEGLPFAGPAPAASPTGQVSSLSSARCHQPSAKI